MFLTYLYNDCIAILPEIFLTISINIVLLYSVIYNTSYTYDYPILLKNISWLCLLILSITFFLNVNNSLYDITIFENLFIVDSLAILVKSFIIIGSICSLIMALNFNQLEFFNNIEFPIFILLTVIGILFLTSSYDLFVMY